jgi:polar amino acid transport system permease protein
LARLRALRWAATIYVEFFRGTSLIVQLFWIFYVLPLLGIRTGPIETGIVVLGLHFGAYGSEIVRGAILAVPDGQRDAAVALNMTPAQTMRRIVLPQAFVAMLPSFANNSIELLKGSAIVSLIAITELATTGRILVQNTGRTAEVFGLVLLLYFLMAFPISRIARYLESRRSAFEEGQTRGV